MYDEISARRDRVRAPAVQANLVVVGRGLSIRLYRRAAWSVIEVEGDLDIQSVPLRRRVLAATAPCMVFDLGRVGFMDASGLAFLVAGRLAAAEAGGGWCGWPAPRHRCAGCSRSPASTRASRSSALSRKRWPRPRRGGAPVDARRAGRFGAPGWRAHRCSVRASGLSRGFGREDPTRLPGSPLRLARAPGERWSL